MALAAATVWEVRTTGADTNGGAFVTGAAGTDWSQQDAAQYSVTNGVTNGTTTVTSATANFGTDVVGNVMYVQGGTGGITAGWYQITARTNSTTITVDRSTGLTAGTGVTLKIGGALASPSLGAAQFTSGNSMHIKAGTYTISSTSSGVSNGIFVSSQACFVSGYSSTRGDMPEKGSQPLLQASGISTVSLFQTPTSADNLIQCISVDGASLTSIKGFNLGRGHSYKLNALNCTNIGIANNTDTPVLFNCSASGCTGGTAAISGCICFYCEAYDNTITGFSLTGTLVPRLVRCLAYRNTGSTSDGFSINSVDAQCVECTAYGNGRDGFRMAAQSETFAWCVAEGNGATDATGAGFRITSNGDAIINCAGYNNAGGNTVTSGSGRLLNVGFITGTSTFFINAAAGNFGLNGTSGGGAAVRSLSTTFPAGTSIGYQDIGAVQHFGQDTVILMP